MAGLMRTLTGAISPAEAQRDAGAWLDEGMTVGHETSAGVPISENNMVSLSAVFASVRAIAEDVAKLPFKLYERGEPRGDGLPRGKFEARDHPLWSLVTREPNEQMTPFDFRQALVASALMWHGGFAEIIRSGSRPVALSPIHPSLVSPKIDDGGQIFYQVRQSAGRGVGDHRTISRGDMIHLKGFGDTGLVGWMISRTAGDAMGVYKAAETFTGKFFANGISPGGVVTFDGNVKQDTLDDYERRLQKKRGGVRNAFRIMMFGGGAKYTPNPIDAEKAQLTETLQFRIEDIARWFRIPPHKIQHLLRSTFSNIESQSLEYVQDTLMPWLVRSEQEFAAKLLFRDETDLFFEHSVNALLRGDMASRSAFYNAGIQGGWMTRNEVRDMENRNPYEGGDAFLIQQNMATVSADGSPEPVNEGPSDGDTADPQDQTEGESGDSGAVPNSTAWMPVFVQAAEKLIAREVKAIRGRKQVTDEWLEKFYSKHKTEIAEAVIPCIQSLCMGLNLEQPNGLPDRYAAMHVAESKRLLSESDDLLSELQRWSNERPARIAQYLIDEVCDA